ncbi:MAG: hypothetical protein KDD73_05160 [Anaerolineales bacterium]|nr:hypothetical protein [Anaerolineales bacterium]
MGRSALPLALIVQRDYVNACRAASRCGAAGQRRARALERAAPPHAAAQRRAAESLVRVGAKGPS